MNGYYESLVEHEWLKRLRLRRKEKKEVLKVVRDLENFHSRILIEISLMNLHRLGLKHKHIFAFAYYRLQDFRKKKHLIMKQNYNFPKKI